MSDIDINIGYIGKNIVALCDDAELSYAFYAEYDQERQVFLSEMSSNDGLVTTGRFNNTINARQIVMIAMAKHMDVKHQRQQREASSMAAEPNKLH